jgi:hypothetical protein
MQGFSIMFNAPSRRNMASLIDFSIRKSEVKSYGLNCVNIFINFVNKYASNAADTWYILFYCFK